MLTLTKFELDLNSGKIVCTILCSVLGQSATIQTSVPEADVIAHNNGQVPWTESTIVSYLGTLGYTVSL